MTDLHKPWMDECRARIKAGNRPRFVFLGRDLYNDFVFGKQCHTVAFPRWVQDGEMNLTEHAVEVRPLLFPMAAAHDVANGPSDWAVE